MSEALKLKKPIKNRSAGVVVLKNNNDEFQVLFMRAYSYWDFPKGKIEEGEDKLQAALREVSEEAGLTNLNFLWGYASFETPPYSKIKKTATYFIAESPTDKVIMGINEKLGRAEHDEYCWLSFDKARRLASPRILDVLNWAEKIIKPEIVPNSPLFKS